MIDVAPSGTIELRVRYSECDPMGFAHHSAYLPWFEMGRTELCRASGLSYRELETQGVFLSVVSLAVRYRGPARYDDVLALETTVARLTRARIDHAYRLLRDGWLLATATTTLACLDRSGRPQPLPDHVRTACS